MKLKNLKKGNYMKLKNLRNLLIGVFVTLLFTGFADIYFEINKNLELFGKVYKEISFNYVSEIEPEQFMRAGIQGMLSSLDPYTIFIDDKRKEDIDLITHGKYGGIGISIGLRGDNVTVVEVMDGYSAQRQGIKVGDIIIEAGGVKINSDNVNEISSLVKGEPGSTVYLIIVRSEASDTIDFDIVREEVIVKNVTFAEFYPENSNNVYLKLNNFSRSASDEIKNAIRRLKAEKNIESMVMDLRGNPGGLLDIAVDICDKFLPKDYLIVSTKGRVPSSIKEYFSSQEPMLSSTKLILLINEGSASASEIVAGAIQDHDRGVILGTQSFGKGLVQTITPLTYNTSLKITTARYYTPSGRNIQKINYSDNNKVFVDGDSVLSGEFLTDHDRIVYSKGGIAPDTIVTFAARSKIVIELLAHGLFFKYANRYYYNNMDKEFNTIDAEEVLIEFEEYIQEKDFQYSSDAETHINLLIKDISENYDDLAEELKNLKVKINDLKKNDFNLRANEIRIEIFKELVKRFLGSEETVKHQLETDIQFLTAVEILNNEAVYNRLLNVN